jgi:hypothetical protein
MKFAMRKIDVDGSCDYASWKKTPTKEQIHSILEDYYYEPELSKYSEELFRRGIVDILDGACTQFEIENR